jgi:hypothetical protein
MNLNNKKPEIVSVLVGSPLAVVSKMATEIFLALITVISLKLQNRLDPQEILRFTTDALNDLIIGLTSLLINLIVLPFAIGCLIAQISKTNVMICAIIVGLVSLSVGLYLLCFTHGSQKTIFSARLVVNTK